VKAKNAIKEAEQNERDNKRWEAMGDLAHAITYLKDAYYDLQGVKK
jgi:hypothetical protein